MRVATADVIVLGAAQRQPTQTSRRQRGRTLSAGGAARIVLWAAGGATNAAITAKLNIHIHIHIHIDTVRRWRHRFATENAENAENIASAEDPDFPQRPVAVMPDDRPRSGRPRTYGATDRIRIVAAVTQELPETESHWSHTLLAEHLAPQVGISAAQIGSS